MQELFGDDTGGPAAVDNNPARPAPAPKAVSKPELPRAGPAAAPKAVSTPGLPPTPAAKKSAFPPAKGMPADVARRNAQAAEKRIVLQQMREKGLQLVPLNYCSRQYLSILIVAYRANMCD